MKKKKNNKKNKKEEPQKKKYSKEDSEDEDNKNSNNEEEDNDNKDDDDNEEDDREEIDIKYLKGNYFIFAKTNKKKVVTIPKSSKQPGVQIEIDNFTKGGSRQFEIEPVEDGMYTIKSLISGLYLKIKEGFKNDEVVQDELDPESLEYKWIFEIDEEEKKCVYIKSAVGGSDAKDFYMIIDGYVPKSHAKIIIGPYEPSQKFLLYKKG